MNACKPHAVPTLGSFSIPSNIPVLTLTAEELAAFDPLTRLAAKMMIANGKAILADQEAG